MSGVWVGQMIWKGVGQLSEIPDMGKDMGEAHGVAAGTRFAYGVAGGISVSNRRRRGETSRGGTVEGGGGVSVCGMKDTGPYSGMHLGQILD